MNALYGFQGELSQKYGKSFTSIFDEVFCTLPLGCVLSEQIFIMHGGLFSDSEITIQRLNAIDRFKEPSDNGVFSEILWSDPCDSCGKFPNKRGVGIAFGPDITKNFLNKNGLKLVIRSHEVKDQVSIFHIIAILCHRSFHEYFLGLRNSARQQFDHSFQCTKLL